MSDDERLNDPAELERLYWEEGMSLRAIAEELGCETHYKVNYRFKKFNIPTRTAYDQQNYASLRKDKDGYPFWREYYDGEYNRVLVHRLLAVAEYGFESVIGNDVHHKNGHRFDNRPDNIELLDPSDHRRMHGEEKADQQRELMYSLIEDGTIDPLAAAKEQVRQQP